MEVSSARARAGPGRRRGLRRRDLPQPRPRPPRLPRRRRGLLRGQGVAVHARARPAWPDQPRRRVRPAAARGRDDPDADLLDRRGRRRLAGRSTSSSPATARRFTVLGPDGLRVAARGARARDLQRLQRAGRDRLGGDAGLDADARRRPASARAPACPAGSSRSTPARTSRVVVDYAHKPDAVAGRDRDAAPADRRPGDRRARRRRRPRPGQAPDHGRDRGPAGRRADRHRRQPAHRGPRRDPGRDARPAPATAGPRWSRSATVAPRSSRPYAAQHPATSC